MNTENALFRDYESLLELPIQFNHKSFLDQSFTHTNSSIYGKMERSLNLFSNDHFSVLIFGFSYEGNGNVFIRFKTPHESQLYNSNIYYELSNNGMSLNGTAGSFKGHNPWNKIGKDINIYVHNNNMFIDFGLILHDTNPFLRYNSELETINNELSLGYFELPDSVRDFEYTCKNESSNEYIIATHSVYRYEYDSLLFYIVSSDNHITPLVITGFSRYRDGGTSVAQLIDPNGNNYTFTYPNYLGDRDNPKSPTLNDNVLTRNVSDKEKEYLSKLINLQVKPKDGK